LHPKRTKLAKAGARKAETCEGLTTLIVSTRRPSSSLRMLQMCGRPGVGMKRFVAVGLLFSLMAFLVVALSACGGGGVGSGGGTSLSPVSTSPTFVMPANAEVLVPSGAIITSGSVVLIVNGSNDTVYTQVGAVLFVPSTATGTANNTVTTGRPSPGSLSTSPPIVTAIAGSPTQNGVSTDGTGTGAVFNYVYTMAYDSSSGSIVVSDGGVLRLVTQAGVVTTYTNAGLIQTPFSNYGVAVDAAGDIFAAGNNYTGVEYDAYIQELAVSGVVSTFAPSWESTPNDSDTGDGGMTFDTSGNLYLADYINNRIVTFTPAGVMSVFAGNGTAVDQDNVGILAGFNEPIDIKIGPDGNFFVLETSSIREITPQGTVSTVAPVGPVTMFAGLSYSAIAVDPSRNIFVAFATSSTIFPTSLMRISPDGSTTLFSNVASDPIYALTCDGAGNLYAFTYGIGAQILKISF